MGKNINCYQWWIFPVTYFFAQDKSEKGISALLAKYDITQFGNLMSAVVVKSWPSDANGDYIKDEDLIFQYLLNTSIAKTVFQTAGKCCNINKKYFEYVMYNITTFCLMLG